MLPERGFEFIKKNFFIKKNVTYKEKSATAIKQKKLQKFMNQYELYFGTLVLASYYYYGDNT